MISNWTTLSCKPQYRHLLIDLLARASIRHQHSDWTDAFSLIGKQPFLLALQDMQPIACLACPPDPPGVAWLRLFSVASDAPADELWKFLWNQAEAQLIRTDIGRTAVLVTGKWMIPFLKQSEFEKTNSVDFLAWQVENLPALPRSSGNIRSMQSSDLARVTEIDHTAFEEIWRYTHEYLESAIAHAHLATVIEMDGQVVAYLMASATAIGAHIARLAVDPDWQGRGLGKRLVHHALRHLSEHGYARPTVNTQSDNHAALHLYYSLGFRKSGQTFPVFEKTLIPG
ncbi:MAG TPA: GNAT family N-acetyltransferase [Anaerolineae bacterium]|nr:GNAT family N-acetyltransferase [Anaerolineae bacterium]